jgi:CTP synthase (UTP-ammonia lyase)
VSTRTIALVGDYSERHTAHRAIPVALGLAREKAAVDLEWAWVATRDIRDAPGDLAAFSGVWVVPASPYENTDGALAAIRWAREEGRPFLGTCGGFQHALLEFARDAAGIAGADHAETSPEGEDLVVSRLSCSLVEQTGAVNFAPGSLIASAYGAEGATEGYRCNYGLNEAYRAALEAKGMRFTCWDDNGGVRGAELPGHPFFCGVLFQPERAALLGVAPPLAVSLVRAVAASR